MDVGDEVFGTKLYGVFHVKDQACSVGRGSSEEWTRMLYDGVLGQSL